MNDRHSALGLSEKSKRTTLLGVCSLHPFSEPSLNLRKVAKLIHENEFHFTAGFAAEISPYQIYFIFSAPRDPEEDIK